MESRPVNKLAYWDNLKGIFIFLVVFAHCLYSLQDSTLINVITDVIYVFHMPAFVFVTGFLSKSKNARGRDGLLKLVAAYIIFNPLMLLYAYVSFDTVPTLLTPSYSYWFLIAMIVWRLTVGPLSKVRGALAISIAAALLCGFFGDVTNVFAMARIISFYPFFLAGFMLPTEKLTVLYDRRKGIVFTLGIVLLFIAVTSSYLLVRYFSPSDDDLTMAAYGNFFGVIGRTAIFIIAAVAIIGFLLAVPNRSIPGLTTLGSNSMSVFLLHRIPTLLTWYVLTEVGDTTRLIGAMAATLGLTAVFGNNFIASRVDGLLSFCKSFIINAAERRTPKAAGVTAFILVNVVVVGLIPLVSLLKTTPDLENQSVLTDKIYTQITDTQQAEFDDDLKILFSGDLILLEDQVKRAYNEKKYDFDNVFEYTKKYISDADMAIGVFEGPTAGKNAGYSIGNYDDGKTLALNYPEEFAKAVKDAGYDLVTTANNHLLDKGESGALRTLDVLDSVGLDHIGSYRNEREKNTLKILNVDGLKIAVLAYTYGSNGYDTEQDILRGRLAYILLR